MNWLFRACSPLSLLLLLPSCSVNQQVRESSGTGDQALILAAEHRAPEEGRRVLEAGRDMALVRREILPGSCWDWINAVFNRAGFPAKKRKTVFKTAKKGPYADLKQILPGDWLYYVNHSYGGIEHSGIFVDWTGRGGREALVLSYAGEKRQEPGRYRTYDLSSVFAIFRPAMK